MTSRAAAQLCGLALLLLCLAAPAVAQVPDLTYTGLPAEPLIGEVVCPTVEFVNLDTTPGFGPYWVATTPPDVIAVSGGSFLGIAVDVEDLGIIDSSGQVIDPISGAAVPGEEGGRGYLVRVPVGSVIQGQPPLVVEACVEVEVGAEIGVPLFVNFLPGFEFGDTPTGENGPIVGTEIDSQPITPQLARLDKSSTVREGERPPGPTHEFDYRYVVDISEGVQINDFLLSDGLPPEIQWTGAPITVSAPDGILCQVAMAPNAPPTPSGDLEVRCAAITGTAGTEDLVVVMPAYIIDILDETASPTSAVPPFDRDVRNVAEINYGFNGIDYRDQDEEVITAVHVEAWKTVAPGTVVPGDTLTFTVNFGVTDYTAGEGLSRLVLDDVLTDGLEFTDNTVLTVGGLEFPVVPVVSDDTPGVGQTTVTWDITAAVGDDIPVSARGRLTYTALVLQSFADGEPVVAGDPLGNDVLAGFEHSEGATDTNDSDAGAGIDPTRSDKLLFAPDPPPAVFQPGDQITFRLLMDVPSGDTFAVSMIDYLPLPVAFVEDPTTTWSIPPPPFLQRTPVVATEAATNSIRFNFGDVSSTAPVQIAVDLTVQITDEAFSDGLFLTNLLETTSENSAGQVNAEVHAVEFRVGAPDLTVTKGVFDVDNPGAVIDPPPPSDPAQGLVDSDAVGVDAGDVVEFFVTIENVGSKPAYNIEVLDPAVAGLSCDDLQPGDVRTGDGADVSFSGTSLQSGISIPGPLQGNENTPPGGGAPFGSDTLLIRQQCVVDGGVVPAQTIVNEVSIRYTSTATSNVFFPSRSDDASLVVASPTIAKRRTAITPNYSGANNTAHIGEVVSYEVVVTVPEGTSPDVKFEDILDRGMAFIALDEITASDGLTTSEGSFAVDVIGNALITNQGSSTEDLDRKLRIGPGNNDFGFGTVTNANRDNGVADTITLRYRAMVLNWTGNQRGNGRNNRATWSYAAAGGRGEVSANAPNTRIVEPGIAINKTFNPDSADQGNPSTVRIRVQHQGNSDADAFQLALGDLWPFGVTPDIPTLRTVNCNLEPDVLTTTAVLLEAGWEFFPRGSDCTIEVGTTGQPPTPAGSRITNCVDAVWSSLDDRDPALPMPPNNPLGVQRTGLETDPGGVANTYDRIDCAELRIFDVDITKGVNSTNQGHTGSVNGIEELTIGEEVVFDIVVTLPEDPALFLDVLETMPHNGVVLEVVDVEVLPLPPTTNLDFSDPSALFPPTVFVEDRHRNDGIDDTVRFDFGGPVTNTPDSVVDENDRIVMRVTGRVVDDVENRSEDQENNVVLVSFGPGLEGSDEIPVRVVEPGLQLLKTGDKTSVEAGDIVTYRLAVGHAANSTADAFDVELDETLPAELQLIPGSAVVANDCTVPPTSGPVEIGNSVSATWAALPLGAGCTIEFQATVSVDAVTGTAIQNTASLLWRSLDATASNTDDERSYDDFASWNVRVSDPGLLKRLASTSVVETNGNEVTIGEQATFLIEAVFPDGTTLGAQVRDLLPAVEAQLEVVSSRIVSIGRDITTGNNVAPGDPGDDCAPNCDPFRVGFDTEALWRLGDVVNDPTRLDRVPARDGVITFEVVGVVKDVPANVGRPFGPDFVFNEALLEAVGQLSTDGAELVIVEPRLALEHREMDGGKLAAVGAGETVMVELVIRHRSTSSAPAFNVAVDYTLDEQIEWVDDLQVSTDCVNLSVDSTGAAGNPGQVRFDVPLLPVDAVECSIRFPVRTSAALPIPGLYRDESALAWESAPGSTESRVGNDNSFLEYVAGVVNRFDKQVLFTSDPLTERAQHDPDIPDLTIGERVTFRLVATLDEGTLDRVVISDVMPNDPVDGRLIIEDATISRIGENIVTGLPGTPVIDGGANTVSFDFGTVTNTADGQSDDGDVIVTLVTARLIDDTDGPPDFANQDAKLLTNAAKLTYGLPAPLPDEDIDAFAAIDVVEPAVEISKRFGPIVDNRVEIEFVVSNLGTAPAYGTLVTDDFNESGPANWVPLSMQAVDVPPGFVLEQASAGGVTTVTFRTFSAAGSLDLDQVILPGASVVVRFSMALQQPPEEISILNTALAGVESLSDNDPEGRSYDARGDDTLDVPALDATKTWSVAGGVATPGARPGEAVTYTITVTNSGASAATDVVVVDQPDPLGIFQAGSVASTDPGFTVNTGNLPGDTAVEVQFASLPPGASYRFSYAVRVPFPYPAATLQEFVNQATLDAVEVLPFQTDDPDTPAVDDPTVVPIVADPVIEIAKTALSGVVTAGGVAFFRIDYANTGDQDATGVVITDAVPDTNVGSGEVFFSAADSSSGWSCPDGAPSGTVCRFDIGDLAGGQGGELIFAVRLDDPLEQGVTSIENTVFITDDGSNTDPGNCQPDCERTDEDSAAVGVAAVPELTLAKDDGITAAVPGQVVTYTLTVANAGDQDATGLELTDTVGAFVRFNAGASTPGWSCADGAGPGAVCVITRPDLPAGASTDVRFAVTVDAPLPAGAVLSTNVATVTDDGSNSDNGQPVFARASHETPLLAQPDMVIAKTDGGVIGQPGLVFPYTLTYTNQGNQDATGVVLTEVVPTGATHNAAASLPDAWSCPDGAAAGTVCTLQVGSVPAGGGGAAQFGVRVDDPIAPGQSSIINMARVEDDGTNGMDPTPDNNVDSVETLVTLFPPAGRKQARDIGGGRVEWTMTWFNNANERDLPVVVLDPIPEGSTYAPGSLSCAADGDSLCQSVRFDEALNRIEVLALIAEDFGAANDAPAFRLDNEVRIQFVTGANGASRSVRNRGEACWDENNNGDALDDLEQGQVCVPVTATLQVSYAIPTLDQRGRWLLILAVLALAGLARQHLRSRHG